MGARMTEAAAAEPAETDAAAPMAGCESGASEPAADGVVDVIVVGAGVSGCACAATLAEAGARVMVVSSALDVVGLPGYGPAVAPTSGRWAEMEEVFTSLASPLNLAWLDSASVPEDGTPLFVIDRRVVSIETKRALERIPGLQFRQGLVASIRPSRPADALPRGERVEVETVFGETLGARVVVLAVGMALGGVIRIGDQEMAGGRYGEVPADGLLSDLEAAGVSLEVREVRVGSRHGARSRAVTDSLVAVGRGDGRAAVKMLPGQGRDPS